MVLFKLLFRQFGAVLVHKIGLVMVGIKFFYFLEAHFLSHYFSPKILFMAEFSIIILIFSVFQSFIELSYLLLLLHIIMEVFLSILTNHVSTSRLFDKILLPLEQQLSILLIIVINLSH